MKQNKNSKTKQPDSDMNGVLDEYGTYFATLWSHPTHQNDNHNHNHNYNHKHEGHGYDDQQATKTPKCQEPPNKYGKSYGPQKEEEDVDLEAEEFIENKHLQLNKWIQ
ncbi:hypothetical protein Ancab_018916 [Ancistrocladus abbreviatus]